MFQTSSLNDISTNPPLSPTSTIRPTRHRNPKTLEFAKDLDYHFRSSSLRPHVPPCQSSRANLQISRMKEYEEGGTSQSYVSGFKRRLGEQYLFYTLPGGGAHGCTSIRNPWNAFLDASSPLIFLSGGQRRHAEVR